MNSSARKIGILILVVIILPVLIFSFFEIGNLRQNELVIQDIYKNQLNAILFSINQYSDDLIGNLASRIENNRSIHDTGSKTDLTRLITEIPAVKGLVQFDDKPGYLSSVPSSYCDSSVLPEMIRSLKDNDKILRRLQTYLRGGYRKIETIGNPGRNMQWIVYLTHEKERNVINLLMIDPEVFISQVLDPKIQEIAQNKFYIVAFRTGEKLPFYTSNKKFNSGNVTNKRPFWLLKNYQMGIELKDLTIADLARERVIRNLMLIGLADLILLFGGWLIYRNVKKQVELSQLKSEFVAGVSHEIRTPLALISMYIETLEMGRIKDEEKVREYYAIILNETTRLSGMVSRILSFSQIESNKRKYSFNATDINEVVEAAALTFRYTLENQSFRYSFEAATNLPSISADKEALSEALINLIDNAIKYTVSNKEINVRTGIQDKFVYVEVEDHGIGISEKDQKMIFDKFYRVTQLNLANKIKGSGLGLAIVKHIMDAHGGKIFVKSSLGSGSLFRLLFPV